LHFEWHANPTICTRSGRLSATLRVLVPIDPVQPRTATRRGRSAEEREKAIP